jgi:flavin-dependent dehydrogenase
MGRASYSDVVIIGAGIAGLATAVLLRQAGLTVLCLDAEACPHDKVGESLDWSSPSLLARLGIDVDGLIADSIATHKRKIIICESGRPEWAIAPPARIRRPPLRFETVTLHVDRAALDARIFDRARTLGATFLWARVARVETSGDRVIACTTSDGQRVSATWYVDASGTSRVFARSMGIPATVFGPKKVCLWTYFHTPPLYEGTTFFVDNRDPYLAWVWDIPITPTRTSVGLVTTADVLRAQRRAGVSIEGVLREALLRHPRFEGLLDRGQTLVVRRTAFQPYVTETTCGPNWLMVGEAASMPDPLTGNGVTSGIRHAIHAVEVIRSAGARGELAPHQRRLYRRHVRRLGQAFNAHIEQAIYRPELRWGLGLREAVYVYTLFAFFMNAAHARLNPRGRVATAMAAPWFLLARIWIGAMTLVAKAALRRRRSVSDGER